MKVLRSLFTLSVLASAPALAQKVYVDYDKSTDFESYETFAWLPSEESSVKDTAPLMHTRIVNEIELRLSEIYTRVDSNPDLYLTYHADEKEEMRLNTSSTGFGYGSSWGWDPYWGIGFGSSTTSTRTVIDLLKRAIQHVCEPGCG